MKKLTMIALFALVLSGCAQTKAPKSVVTAPESSAPQVAIQPENALTDARPRDEMESTNLARVQQCRKELDAMGVYSKETYDKYLEEYQRIGAQTNRYLQIKDALTDDLVDVVTPRYQYKIRELCFRIKYQLSQLIINAATAP